MIDLDLINKQIKQLNDKRFKLYCDGLLTPDIDNDIRKEIKKLINRKANAKYIRKPEKYLNLLTNRKDQMSDEKRTRLLFN